MVCARRSVARKSLANNPWSASKITTKLTSGKWWPLVSICVPTKIRASPLCTRSSTVCTAPRAEAVSRSSRASGACGKRRARVVFDPLGTLTHRIQRLAAQLAHIDGTAAVRAAVMAAQLLARADAGSCAHRSARKVRPSRRHCRTELGA